MKKNNPVEEYEQLTIDFGDAIEEQPAAVDEAPVEKNDEVPAKKSKVKPKELRVGAKVTVNQDVKRFCDGRGIPDYARIAYIKGMDNKSKTILIESEPNGKEFGVLFAADVSLV